MSPANILLLVLVDGFVAFYCYRAYQQGMPVKQVVLWLLISLVAVNAAFAVGRKLGLRKRQK
ncbi:MAG TPA: hypothetical protein VMD78_07025 [Candidatus Baltobacteraceae bacterium]|nr:hypothetical protein [Candidatus Baltobacteraceae bacterium]